MSLIEILKSGNYKLIDVREPIEIEMDGSIDQAINIPLGTIEEHTEEILSYQVPVVVFCRSGARSNKALEYLQSQGFTNGHNGGGWAELKDTLQNL